MRFFFLGLQQTKKKERNCHCDYSVYLKCVAATLPNRFPILFPNYYGLEIVNFKKTSQQKSTAEQFLGNLEF